MSAAVDAGRLLEVEDLAIAVDDGRRAPVMAVDGVSFTVAPGEALGIVGESGSGKSLTALATMGLLPRNVRVAGGDVRLDGRSLVGDGGRAIASLRGRELAMIFQDPLTALNPALRIGTQVAEPLMRHRGLDRRAAWRQAVELLERVRIPDAARRARRYPHEFSGGMRQRVMIAIAISCGPRLVIADEATTALDVTVQAEILALLDTLRREERLALVIISHDMGVISRVADRTLVMYAGQIVESAPTQELMEDPQHPYTGMLLACRPSLTERRQRASRLVAIPGQPPQLGAWPPGCRFAPRCPWREDGRCASTVPELREIGPGHRVRTGHAARTVAS